MQIWAVMRIIAVFLLVLLALPVWAFSSDVRVLIVGDSWGKLMCLDDSIEDALKHFSIRGDVSCFKTTVMGSKAQDWNSPEKRELIRNAFLEMKNIEVVILSVGGNDYFSAWQKSYESGNYAEMKNKIQIEIKKNIEFIKSQKKNIKIVLSGYDYGNFTVLNEDNFLTHTYVSIFNRVGRPTSDKLNAAFIQMNEQYAKISREVQNVYFSNHMGLIHFYFGIPEHGITKFSTPYPGQYPTYQPMAGGDPRYGNSIEALLTLPFNYKNFIDPYHLNSSGYKVIGEHLVAYYVRHLLSR